MQNNETLTTIEHSEAEVIEMDPFIVLARLELSLKSLNKPKAQMETGLACISLRDTIMGLEQCEDTVKSHGSLIKSSLNVEDPLRLIDQLERAILSLRRPVSRLQAWLGCAEIRSSIMFYEYGKEWKQL